MERDPIETGEVDVMKTLTDTASLDAIIPEIWSKEMEEQRLASLHMRQLAVVNTDLYNKSGDTVHIAKKVKLVAATLTETSAITPQEVTPTNLVDFTPTEKGLAVQVTRKALRRAYLNRMDEITTGFGRALAELEDSELITAVVDDATTIIYPEDYDEDDDITAADILTTDLIDDAVAVLETLNVAKPYVAVIHPMCKRSLVKSEDFTDASKYGSAEVRLTGEIGTYLGVKILVTTQITPVTNTGLVKVYPSLVMGQRAIAVALKADSDYEEDYLPLDRKFNMAGVAEWDSGVLDPDASCVIRSAGGNGGVAP